MSGLALCFGIGFMVCQMPAPPNPTAVVCPPVVSWDAKDQRAAADALAQLPAGHPLRKMGVMAVKQRDLVRACKK